MRFVAEGRSRAAFVAAAATTWIACGSGGSTSTARDAARDASLADVGQNDDGSGGTQLFGDSGGDGGTSAQKCTIATLGVPGTWGQGDIFANWLATGGGSAVTGLKDQVLTSAVLAPFRIVVSLDVSANHAYGASEVATLSDWVNEGGGLMTMDGFVNGPTDIANVNRLLTAFGMSYASGFVLTAKSCNENCPPDRKTTSINHWVAHPVTQGISEIGFANGHATQGPGLMLANEQGFQVLEVQQVGQGRVLSWGDEWITYDIEWTANPQYQVKAFWQNIVDWLSPQSGCQVPNPPQ